MITGLRRRLPIRSSTRRVLLGSLFGIALAVLGILAAAGPAVGDQTTASTLAYTCQFPSGSQPVSVLVNATFPETGTVGEPIVPTNVSVQLDLPQAALADLTQLGAASVTASGSLSVVRTSNGSSVTLDWSDLASSSTPVPTTGSASLTMSGPVPTATVADPGTVGFAADALGLVLTPLTSTGAATNPATLSVACLLNSAQNPTLATVDVVGTPSSQPTTPTGSPAPTSGSVPNTPSMRADAAVAAPTTTVAPGSDCTPFSGPTIHPAIVGRTQLAKLDESSPVGPGVANLTEAGFKPTPFFTICYKGSLQLPPSTTTALAFGFMPITATFEYVQEGSVVVEAWADGAQSDAEAWADEYLVMTSATVNGIPLDLGQKPNPDAGDHSKPDSDAPAGCRTQSPVLLDLTNPAGTNYSAVTGGYLENDHVTIPPFTNCGVAENLDSLLSTPVSGPNNEVRMCQESTVPGQSFVNCKQP